MTEIILGPSSAPANANEGLVLDGLDLNDNVSLVLERFENAPPEPKGEWVESPDADGSLPDEDEERWNSRTPVARIRVKQTGTMDQALTVLGTITQKLRKAARTPGGLALVWSPAGSTKTGTMYVLRGRITEMPMVIEGEDAGWFLRSPVITLELTCRPFVWAAAEIVGPTTTVTTPVGSLEVPNVAGDVSTEARILSTDTAAQARAFVEWGAEADDYVDECPLLIDSDALVTTGFAGVQATRTGAYDVGGGNTVVNAVLTTTPVVVCGTGDQPHIGHYRARPRLFASTDDVYVRLAYRSGDGPFLQTPWLNLPLANQWLEMSLGELHVERATQGTQRWEGRIEAYSDTPGATIDVDYLGLVPTGMAYGVARAPAVDPAAAETYAARDEFDQSAGALTGKVLPAGGTWTVVAGSDADDFNASGSGTATRTAVSDVDLNTGRYVSAGVGNYGNVSVSADHTRSGSDLTADTARKGIFARLVDIDNWLMAVVVPGGASAPLKVQVLKRIGGVVTTLGEDAETFDRNDDRDGGTFTIQMVVGANGFWRAEFSTTADPQVVEFSGYDAALAAGGALDDGRIGVYDASTSGTAQTRTYDNFIAFVIPTDVACHASQSLEIRHDATERENAAGTHWGPPPLYRGARAYLRPAGANNVVNRLGFVVRRADADGGVPVDHLTDGYSVAVFYRPRYLELPN